MKEKDESWWIWWRWALKHEYWNHGYQIEDDDIFPWVFNEENIVRGLLEKGCIREANQKWVFLGRCRYISRKMILLMSLAPPSVQKNLVEENGEQKKYLLYRWPVKGIKRKGDVANFYWSVLGSVTLTFLLFKLLAT